MATELDPEYSKVTAQIKEAGYESADPLTTPIGQARQTQDRYFAFLAQDPPPVASTRDVELEGPAGPFSARIYYPTAGRTMPVIVFVRGAGWWAGSLDSHDRTARLLARESGFAVCAVDYHRAPEHHFPTQLQEVLATVHWLRGNGEDIGIDGERLVLAGESAGANISTMVAVHLKSEFPRAVSGLALFYGNYAAPTEKSRAYSRFVWSQYLGMDPERANPQAVPLEADVSGLPPMWLGVGDADPLLDDTLKLAEKLRAAGVPHEVKIYPGLPHAFVMVSRLYEGAASAVRDAALAAQRFMRQIKR